MMSVLTIVTFVMAFLALVGVVAIYIVYIYEDNCCVDISYVRDLKVANSDLQYENSKLRLENADLEERLVKLHKAYASRVCFTVECKTINDRLENENTALKLKLNEMEENYRNTLDHNAYLANEASRDRAENERLKKIQADASSYLIGGLRSRIASFDDSSIEYERGAVAAYRRVLNEINGLEKKYESEDKKCSN